MYWPIGTPRIFATKTAQAPPPTAIQTSHDGVEPEPRGALSRSSTLENPSTLVTPGIRSVEDEGDEFVQQPANPHNIPSLVPSSVPSQEPLLAFRIARSGHLYATITATSITIWQTKPTVILAVVVRSEPSLSSYGRNVSLLLRPDSAILVVQTTRGYLITYSLATDPDSNVYKARFTSHHNIQRRRQNHSNVSLPPEQIMWGPGEGPGVRDISIRFRMVIKVDAGIQTAIALDEELMVATKKPAAIQCIKWSPDQLGNQTSTEILSRLGWMEKKVSLTEIVHDRPMNLSTWITSDGRAYAVQRRSQSSTPASPTPLTGPEPQQEHPRLFKGFCFHTPTSLDEFASKCAINARFSLIAVGCADGRIRAYSAKDYSGNIPRSHYHILPVPLSTSGSLTTILYSLMDTVFSRATKEAGQPGVCMESFKDTALEQFHPRMVLLPKDGCPGSQMLVGLAERANFS